MFIAMASAHFRRGKIFSPGGIFMSHGSTASCTMCQAEKMPFVKESVLAMASVLFQVS
jgi:hypothetical protein